MSYEPPLDDPIATGAVITGFSEHYGYTCEQCGSDWIRYEHLDYKDCDQLNCEDPCKERCCNEEGCIGDAIYSDPKQNTETYDTLEEMHND
jgi:hypothetical protein